MKTTLALLALLAATAVHAETNCQTYAKVAVASAMMRDGGHSERITTGSMISTLNDLGVNDPNWQAQVVMNIQAMYTNPRLINASPNDVGRYILFACEHQQQP